MTQELVPSTEYVEWNEYFKTSPPESEHADWRTALQTAQLLNAFKGKKGSSIEAKDMLLRFGDPSDRPSTQTLITKLQSWAATLNASRKKKRGN